MTREQAIYLWKIDKSNISWKRFAQQLGIPEKAADNDGTAPRTRQDARRIVFIGKRTRGSR